MAINAQNTELHVTPGGIIPVVHVSQYDENRVLTFQLMDGNNAANIPSGATVAIEGTKPSRHGFSYEATLAGSVVTVNTTLQMTVEQGTVECKLKVTSGTQIIGTALFLMEVEQAGISDGTIVSDTDIPMIIALAREQEEHAAESALKSEGYAVGTQNGEPVAATSPYYHYNSEYFADQAATESEEAEYWSGKSQEYAEDAAELYNEVSSMIAVIHMLVGTVYIVDQNDNHITTQSGDRLIINY